VRAYELPVTLTSEGRIELPDNVVSALQAGATVRVIVLVDDLEEPEGERAWEQLTAEQFLAGYGDSDAIYDRV